MRPTPSLRSSPNVAFDWNGSNVRLVDDGPFSPFQGRSSRASSSHASFLHLATVYRELGDPPADEGWRGFCDLCGRVLQWAVRNVGWGVRHLLWLPHFTSLPGVHSGITTADTRKRPCFVFHNVRANIVVAFFRCVDDYLNKLLYSLEWNRNWSFAENKPNVDVLFHCVDDCQNIQYWTKQILILYRV